MQVFLTSTKTALETKIDSQNFTLSETSADFIKRNSKELSGQSHDAFPQLQ